MHAMSSNWRWNLSLGLRKLFLGLGKGTSEFSASRLRRMPGNGSGVCSELAMKVPYDAELSENTRDLATETMLNVLATVAATHSLRQGGEMQEVDLRTAENLTQWAGQMAQRYVTTPAPHCGSFAQLTRLWIYRRAHALSVEAVKEKGGCLEFAFRGIGNLANSLAHDLRWYEEPGNEPDFIPLGQLHGETESTNDQIFWDETRGPQGWSATGCNLIHSVQPACEGLSDLSSLEYWMD